MFNKKDIKVAEIKDSMTWWLNRNRPFIVGDIEISLIEINPENGCAKILIKNLKTGKVSEQTHEA